jgi:uroporphyrinogen-III synthase
VNIVLTREAGKNDPLRAWLPSEVTVNEVPLTSTIYYDTDDVRDALEASSTHGTYRALVVTSERSADYVEIALHASTPDVELFVVGATTKDALSARGVGVHAQGDGSAETLAPRISRGPVLLLGAKAMRGELVSALRVKGLEVDAVACYETVGVTLDPNDTAILRNADVLFIGAPSAWSGARAYVRSDAWVIVPGASTGSIVRSEHPKVIEGWGPQLRSRLTELSH